jgi:hypothetical protein
LTFTFRYDIFKLIGAVVESPQDAILRLSPLIYSIVVDKAVNMRAA